MKKILYIFLLFAGSVNAQVIKDSTALKIADAEKGFFYKVSGVGFGLDGVRAFMLGPDVYARFYTGEWQNSHFGIFPNGTNMFSRIQNGFDSSYVTKMWLTGDSSGTIIANGGTLNFRGKTLAFKGGTRLDGTATVSNVRVEANARDEVFGPNIQLGANVVFVNGLSIMNLGASPDSSSTKNAAVFRKITTYNGLYPNQVIKVPKGTFWIKRHDTRMITPTSDMKFEGEGFGSIIKLDTADYYNFRRIFDLGPGVKNVEISNMSGDLSNKVSNYDSVSSQFYDSPGDLAGDGQNAFIFTYSSDSLNPVSNCYFHDLRIQNVTGDIITISKNSKNITIERIYMKDYLRQGISLGGGNVDGVWVKHITDEGSAFVTKIGGHSIHCEPSSAQKNVNYLNNYVRDLSYGGVSSGTIKDNITFGTATIFCNVISNTEISGNIFNSLLQVSAVAEGNVNIHDNIELRGGLYLTTVSGASSSPKPITVVNNPKINAVGRPAIWLNNMDSLVVDNNGATNSGDVTVRIANCRGTVITNNRIKKTGTGNYEALYSYSSSSSLFGVGMDYINNNIIDGDYRGIRIGNKSAIIGPSNVVNAPTPYEISTAKIFPYRGPDGKQYLKFLGSGLPTYKDWAVGDVVENTANTPGEQRFWICDTAGAAHQGNWNPSLTYYINAYVRDSTNGRVYRSKAVNGQNELPSSDTDNTYWEQVATRTASFVGSDAYKGELWGFGVPTRTDVATGTIYHRRDGDSCTSIYTYSATGWKASGCGGSGIGADEVEEIVDGKLANLDSTLLPVEQEIIDDDTLSTTVGTVTIKNKLPGSPLRRSDSLFAKTSAQRMYGTDVIADIIDRRTGVSVTYTKKTTYNGVTILNSDTDNVMITKINSDFWVRNVQGDIDANIYNLVPDGSTDNTTAFQKLVNFANRFKKKIYFPVGAGVYKVTGKVTVSSSVVMSFAPGAILGIDTLDGGVVDAPYWQQIFTDTSVVNLSAVAGGRTSVRWFGAKGDNSNNDQPAIQQAANMIMRNPSRYTLLYFPAGTYKIDDPIQCAYYSSGGWNQVYITLKGEGEGYSSKFPSRGAKIRATFKDRPMVWWQIGKSGGMESLALEGAFTNPTMTAAQFYNSNLSDYTDPTCRDSSYSPYAAIAVDAVKYTGAPPDGGYPGFNYTASNNTTSGSSGLTFKDLNISKVYVGMVFSPNGQTQNNDAITMSDIKVADCAVGFASCQDQEKGNKFMNIVSWGVVHTVFTNQGFGNGTSGNIYIQGANIAAFNNTFIDWKVNGRFPCYIKDVYTESLGKIGSIISNASTISVSDCVFRLAHPVERGNYSAPWHLQATRGVSFNGCSFMTYAAFTPFIIDNTDFGSNGATYNNCYFEVPPIHFSHLLGGTSTFNNCEITNSGRIGVTNSIGTTYATMRNYSSYGTTTLQENSTSYTSGTSVISQIKLNGNRLHRAANAGSVTVSVATDRSDTITVSSGNAAFFSANRAVYFYSAGTGYIFGGIVTSADNIANTVIVKNIPITVTDGSYTMYSMNPEMIYGGLGDFTSGSSNVLNYRGSTDIGIFAGQLISHPAISGGYAIVTAVSGDTLKLNKNATQTLVGEYIGSPGMQRNYTNPSSTADASAFSSSTILQKGGTLIGAGGIKYLVTKSGFFSASGVGGGETRQAEWSNEAPKYTLVKNASRDSIIIYENGIQVGAIKDSTGGGGSPGGSDTYVQINDGGSFGGDAGLLYNKVAKRLSIFSSSSVDLSWKNDHGLKLIHPRMYIGDTTSTEPSFIEFGRYPYSAVGRARGVVGFLGSSEVNLAFNMNYRGGSHEYYDPTKDAIWTYLGPNGFGIQGVGKNHTNSNIYNNYGKNLYRVDWVRNGDDIVASRLTVNGIKVADYSTTNQEQTAGRFFNISIADTTATLSGVKRLELPDSLNITMGHSAALGKITMTNTGSFPGMYYRNVESNTNGNIIQFNKLKGASQTLDSLTYVGNFLFNGTTSFGARIKDQPGNGISLSEFVWRSSNVGTSTVSDIMRLFPDGELRLINNLKLGRTVNNQFNGIDFNDASGTKRAGLQLQAATGPFQIYANTGYWPEIYANNALAATWNTSGYLGLKGITSPSAFLHLSAGTSAAASLMIPAGVAPSSPVGGNIWRDALNNFVARGGLKLSGHVSVDSVDNGTAGTDSLVVWDATSKQFKKVSPTYYSTSGLDTTVISTKANVVHQISQAVQSGPYIPTITGGTNYASGSVSLTFHHQRINNEIHIKGIIEVTATTGSSSTVFRFTPPYGNVTSVSGSAVGVTNAGEIRVLPVAASNEIQLTFTSPASGNTAFYIDLMFTITP